MKGAVIKMNAVNNPMDGVFCDAVTQADGVNHTRNARKTGGHEMRERVLSAVVCVFLPILAAVASCENMRTLLAMMTLIVAAMAEGRGPPLFQRENDQ